MVKKLFILIVGLFLGCSSDSSESPNPNPNPGGQNDVITIYPSQIINESYIGNGAQWDAYPNAYKNWNSPLSEADWAKLALRLDYMKPKLMRVIIDAGANYAGNGGYEPELNLEPLARILQYCTNNNITVMFGDWGGNLVDPNTNTINEINLTNAAKFVDYLVNTKGFSCIKYYNMINEPNGSWSSNNGNYDLWVNAVNYFYQQMETLGVTDKVKIVGPDIAIWTTNEVPWIQNAARDIGDEKIGLYDIHTYPGQIHVNSKDYSSILESYIEKVPPGKKMVMGELGFKYDPNVDASLHRGNIERAEADPFASNTDSNMYVKDFFYGVDMADASMQIVNAGYSGIVVWMLDDAMHNTGGGNGKDLKTWGFWNILGEELFGGAAEEEIRPWFYTYALLTRYMQDGVKVLKVDIPNKRGLNAIAITNGNEYAIAIVNSGFLTYTVDVKFDAGTTLNNIKQFIYEDDNRPIDGNGFPVPTSTGLSLDLSAGHRVDIKGQSFTLFTNFNY
ncbi:hypothetical protein [Flavivirga spongiicola]|uniref:Glycoside hydrolase family 5 domain-containing protein n=1 Tax=Flavivirga spongiicola TaxID=421621 RepID=A0ABU7XWB9_9FLAO|nr:hypothetical protein [Flavivirga sp. MEBiC05379]MDO5980084.1 hypothetical protein [Flavivirga sp. MEBiC05379]